MFYLFEETPNTAPNISGCTFIFAYIPWRHHLNLHHYNLDVEEEERIPRVQRAN
jgi:hypothetical protein